jgi:hemoglobin
VPKKQAPLWDRLGGEKGVKVIVHDIIEAALKDPKVNFTRNGKYKFDEKKQAQLEEHFVELVSSDFAHGPIPYTGKKVPTVHADMMITDAEYDAFVGHVAAALKKNKVSAEDSADILLGMVAIKPLFVKKK